MISRQVSCRFLLQNVVYNCGAYLTLFIVTNYIPTIKYRYRVGCEWWGCGDGDHHTWVSQKQRRRKLRQNFGFAWNIEKERDTQQSTIEGKRHHILHLYYQAYHNDHMHNCLSKTTRQNLLVHAEEIDLRGERAKEDEAFVDNSTIFLPPHSWTTQLHSTMHS